MPKYIRWRAQAYSAIVRAKGCPIEVAHETSYNILYLVENQ